jgi:hypothetical protein
VNSDNDIEAPMAELAGVAELAKQASVMYTSPVAELAKQASMYTNSMAELGAMAKQASVMYTSPVAELAKQASMYTNSMAELGAMAKQASVMYTSPVAELAKQASAMYTSPVAELAKQASMYTNSVAGLGAMAKQIRISGLSNAWLAGFESGGANNLVASIRDDLAVDPALVREIDEFFESVGAPDALIDATAEALGLTVPFGYDAAVRAGLQAIAVTSLFAILLMVFIHNPVLGAVLSAAGTPNSVATWKATGRAYDRLYGVEAKDRPKPKKTG